MLCVTSDLLVWSKACLTTPNPSELSSQPLTSAALHADGSCTTGPRVIPSAKTRLLTPPDSYTHTHKRSAKIKNSQHVWIKTNEWLTLTARHPRLVLATKHPSVVAMGTWNSFPSNSSGPATPTGTGTYPITFSQLVPVTWEWRKSTWSFWSTHVEEHTSDCGAEPWSSRSLCREDCPGRAGWPVCRRAFLCVWPRLSLESPSLLPNGIPECFCTPPAPWPHRCSGIEVLSTEKQRWDVDHMTKRVVQVRWAWESWLTLGSLKMARHSSTGRRCWGRWSRHLPSSSWCVSQSDWFKRQDWSSTGLITSSVNNREGVNTCHVYKHFFFKLSDSLHSLTCLLSVRRVWICNSFQGFGRDWFPQTAVPSCSPIGQGGLKWRLSLSLLEKHVLRRQ